MFGDAEGIAGELPGTVEVLDGGVTPTLDARELERARIEAGVPAWGKELDESILPAEAGLDETHISFTKGCYPGQEPIARLHYRGHVNRRLRVLEVESAQPGDEIGFGDKVVGRVTSAVPGRRSATSASRCRTTPSSTSRDGPRGSRQACMRPARFELATSASAGQRSIP